METLEDNSIMPFGMHEGKKLEDVPAAYLIWLWNAGVKTEVKFPTARGALARYIKKNRGALEKEAPDSIMDK